MVENVFEYTDYRQYLRDRMKAMPRKGRGAIRKIAESVGIDPSYFSQILSGSRSLSSEQTVLIAKFLGFTPAELDYFLELTRLERAGNSDLKNQLERRLNDLRSASKAQAAQRASLSSVRDQAIFFSNWYYDAIRLAISIHGKNTIDQIAQYLNLSLTTVRQVTEFLIQVGLIDSVNGKLKGGQQHLVIDSDSPLIDRHLLNWRAAAAEKLPRAGKNELFHSLPMTLTTPISEEIKTELKKIIQLAESRAKNTGSERLFCLNIDWFEIGGSV